MWPPHFAIPHCPFGPNAYFKGAQPCLGFPWAFEPDYAAAQPWPKGCRWHCQPVLRVTAWGFGIGKDATETTEIINIWAAEIIWYKTQLTGCSYLVFQSRDVFWGLTSFSNAALVFNSKILCVRCLPRSRGVPTSFYNLTTMFSTNRGTPQYYSPFNQIKDAAQYIFIYILYIYYIYYIY